MQTNSLGEPSPEPAMSPEALAVRPSERDAIFDEVAYLPASVTARPATVEMADASQESESGAAHQEIEDGEGSNEMIRLEKLARDVSELQALRRQNFAIGNLANEGGQALLNRFGGEGFAKALGEVVESGEPLSMHRVACRLLPNAKDRLALYDEMDQMIDQELNAHADLVQQAETEGDPAGAAEAKRLYGHEFGISGNSARLNHQHIAAYRTLDRLSPDSAINQRLQGLLDLATNVEFTQLVKSGTLSITHLAPFDATAFIEELADNGGSLQRLYAERNQDAEVLTDQIRGELHGFTDAVHDQLSQRRRQLEAQAEVDLDTYRAQLLSHLFERLGLEEAFAGHEDERQRVRLVAEAERRLGEYQQLLGERINQRLEPTRHQLERARGLEYQI